MKKWWWLQFNRLAHAQNFWTNNTNKKRKKLETTAKELEKNLMFACAFSYENNNNFKGFSFLKPRPWFCLMG